MTDNIASRVDRPVLAQQPSAKVIRAAIVGTVVEFYDFGIFGYMATTMAALFFVSDDPTASLLGTFATFAVAFILRIPGGIFFGHIGDKYGRKTALSWTILLMVAATTSIGLLPSYLSLGLWATVLLVLARALQGFAAGGEIGGANAVVAESAPIRWRATQTSMVNTGTYLGSLLASLAALAITVVFDAQTLLDWAWRIPFLLSVVLGIVGIWIRSQLDNTPEFKKLEESGETKDLPILELLRTARGNLIRVFFLGGLITGGYYIASVYCATYLKTTAGHSPTVAFLSTSTALVVGVVVLPIAGFAADKFGRKPVLLTGSALAVVLGVPMFVMMGSGSVWQAVVGQTVLFTCVSIVNGASFVTYVEMFKTSVRYSALALGNNVTNILLGGTAPFIATYLISITGNTLAPAGYFVFCGLLSLGGSLSIKETRGTVLQTA